jgi:hypothetical protein
VLRRGCAYVGILERRRCRHEQFEHVDVGEHDGHDRHRFGW